MEHNEWFGAYDAKLLAEIVINRYLKGDISYRQMGLISCAICRESIPPYGYNSILYKVIDNTEECLDRIPPTHRYIHIDRSCDEAITADGYLSSINQITMRSDANLRLMVSDLFHYDDKDKINIIYDIAQPPDIGGWNSRRVIPQAVELANIAYNDRPGRKQSCVMCNGSLKERVDELMNNRKIGLRNTMLRINHEFNVSMSVEFIERIWRNDVSNCYCRVRDGRISNDVLFALADSLEEAGCDYTIALNHLRSGIHYRGCWVLDLCRYQI